MNDLDYKRLVALERLALSTGSLPLEYAIEYRELRTKMKNRKNKLTKK